MLPSSLAKPLPSSALHPDTLGHWSTSFPADPQGLLGPTASCLFQAAQCPKEAQSWLLWPPGTWR
jgi:hypothetical protein